MTEDYTDWSLIDFEDKKPRQEDKPVGGKCPKCGKPLGKGGHFHVKACNGKAQS